MYKIFNFFQTLPQEQALFFMALGSLALSLFCFLCLGIMIILRIIKREKLRKEERAKKARTLQFSLPQKDNEFIRERLLHVLNNEKKDAEDTRYQEKDLQITYAQTLLEKLVNAPLSAIERIETEETARLLKLTFSRGEWTAQELRMINDCFVTLLKTSAKYAV